MEPITRRAALGAALAIPAAAALAGAARAANPTEIERFFPVPVQGMLANKMRELVDRFNAAHADIKVTAVYTGSYDDTNLKTRAANQSRQASRRGDHVGEFCARIRHQ